LGEGGTLSQVARLSAELGTIRACLFPKLRIIRIKPPLGSAGEKLAKSNIVPINLVGRPLGQFRQVFPFPAISGLIYATIR